MDEDTDTVQAEDGTGEAWGDASTGDGSGDSGEFGVDNSGAQSGHDGAGQGGNQGGTPPPIDHEFLAMLQENQGYLQQQQGASGGVGGGDLDGVVAGSAPPCTGELVSALAATGRAILTVQALLEEIAAAETIIALAAIIPTAIAAHSALSDMIDNEQAYLDCADQHPDAVGHDEIEKIREGLHWAMQKNQEILEWIAEQGRLPLPF